MGLLLSFCQILVYQLFIIAHISGKMQQKFENHIPVSGKCRKVAPKNATKRGFGAGCEGCVFASKGILKEERGCSSSMKSN
jgi:hypothetical protein